MMISCAKRTKNNVEKKRKEKQAKPNYKYPCCFISLVTMEESRNLTLALALLKLPLHTIIKVETARAVKQSILLLLIPADVI